MVLNCTSIEESMLQSFFLQKLSETKLQFVDLAIRTKLIGGGRPIVPENLGQTDRVEAKQNHLFSIYFPRNI